MIGDLNQEIRGRVYDLLEPAHPIFELRSSDRGITFNDAAEALYPRRQRIEFMGYRAFAFTCMYSSDLRLECVGSGVNPNSSYIAIC